MAVGGCELTIGGEKDALAPVTVRVEFSESIDELDALTVWLEMPPGYANRAALVKKLKPGAEFELTFAKRTIKGDIVEVRWTHHAQAGDTWVVHGLEPLHRIRGLQQSELSELKLDKIVENLMKKGPSAVQANPVAATAKELVLLDDSGLRLIKRIATERNFAFFLDAKGKVNFAPRNSKGAKVRLNYADLQRIDISADLVGMPTSVEARGYDYRKDASANDKLKFEASAAKLAKISGDDTGPSLRPSSWGKLPIALEHRFSAIDLKELEDRAIGALQMEAERFVRGELMADLTPTAMPTAELEVAGAPWPYMGPYRVSASTHTFGPGAGSDSRVEFFSDSLPPAPT